MHVQAIGSFEGGVFFVDVGIGVECYCFHLAISRNLVNCVFARLSSCLQCLSPSHSIPFQLLCNRNLLICILILPRWVLVVG